VRNHPSRSSPPLNFYRLEMGLFRERIWLSEFN
jgi:hypothetical protein